MATLQVNTNFASGDYNTDLINFLMPEENDKLLSDPANPDNLRPQYDGGNSIAIGYGLDLLNNSISDITR